MAQIQAPYTFVTGDQITAANLNAHTNSAILLPGSITDQPNITANTVVAGDSVALHDISDLTLKEATVGDLLNSGIGITTGSIAGVTGANLVVTPAATFALSVAGNLTTTANFAVTGTSTLTGNVTASGTLTVTGNAVFNTTEAIKIPVGTTVQRPASPVTGQFRYNSTVGEAEVYDGTVWKAVGGGPFDATGGGITTVDGYKIHTFIVSGTFTPDLTKEGKIEVLVVGGGGGGASAGAPGGGGGGGGAVVHDIINIPKGTAPITITVGSGGIVGANGTASTFGLGPITANGGQAGSGFNGGTSGSGFAGGSGNSQGAGGGGGAQAAQTFKWTDAGGIGGQGFGSTIEGSLKVYGGGGGGGSFGAAGRAPGVGIYGGGNGGGGLASINSGGGGGGSSGGSASAGADGIVVIRYRVS